MLSQIDNEMRRRRVEAILVTGETTLANPNLTYVAGGTIARGGIYFNKLGRSPLLIVSNLDLPTARRLACVKKVDTFTHWGLERLAARYGREGAYAQLIAKILLRYRITGRVLLFGRNEADQSLRLAARLKELGVKLALDQSPSILESARRTKSREELRELRRVGEGTARVVESTLEMLRSLKRRRGHLEFHGKRATVSLIKDHIGEALIREHLWAPEGIIFSVGAASADPHNLGVPTDEIKEGKPIVFDIFPQAASGYWFDMTRSFCIGRADSKAKVLFETVLEAQLDSLDFLKAGVAGEEAMSRACDVMGRRGFRTVRDIHRGETLSLNSGFIHSLGHGVGLTIGELPYLAFHSPGSLMKGDVVTVEPGLYRPGYGGVRIEDTVAVKSDGVEKLSDVDVEFELT